MPEDEIEGVEAEEEEQPAAQPGFAFDSNGIRVDAEDSPVAGADEPLKVAFGVCNIGGGGGYQTPGGGGGVAGRSANWNSHAALRDGM